MRKMVLPNQTITVFRESSEKIPLCWSLASFCLCSNDNLQKEVSNFMILLSDVENYSRMSATEFGEIGQVEQKATYKL